MKKARTAGDAWEWMWAPYDEATYTAVLQHILPDDIVLEIGAGDFRLARRLASRAKAVYAVERQQNLLEKYAIHLPPNCQVIAGDARQINFPSGITVAVLLMRHCRHLYHYWRKLLGLSCRKLITNARWGMDVEIIELGATRCAFKAINLGWYACCCGHTGFVSGDASAITHEVINKIWEVSTCPACSTGGFC